MLEGTRILFMLPSLALGGAERQALVLARYLKDAQAANVQVWGFGDPGEASSLCEEYNLPWRSVPIPPGGARLQQLASILRFGKVLRAQRPAVLLPYAKWPNIWCGASRTMAGANLCIWGQRNDPGSRKSPLLERFAARNTSLFVANSPHLRQVLRSFFHAPDDRIHIVPNGIELPASKWNAAKWREHLGVTANATLLCMVANLTDQKDHVTLLHAWRDVQSRLTSSGKEAKLLLAGSFGNTHESLVRLAGELNLGDTVCFLGQVKDISGLLSAVNIGLLSSRAEGSPNAVLECMEAGLPVAGTDVSGIREALGPDGCEFLAPAGDSERLADLLITLISNRDLVTRSGLANRQRVEDEFSPARMCDRMTTLIDQHLTSPRTSSRLRTADVHPQNARH